MSAIWDTVDSLIISGPPLHPPSEKACLSKVVWEGALQGSNGEPILDVAIGMLFPRRLQRKCPHLQREWKAISMALICETKLHEFQWLIR